jgi:hypothetical protein
MYTIKDLAMMSGLSDRTLRNYLNTGILKGEKIDGAWCFSEADIDNFFSSATAQTAMRSRKNADVYDFAVNSRKKDDAACIMLDLPTKNSMKVAKFFCEAVNKRQGLKMTFDSNKGINRVILIGSPETLSEIMAEYISEFKN